MPKYPNIRVKLTGRQDNSFFILGNVQKALKANGIDKPEIDAYTKEATAGDFNNLLAVTMNWVDVR